MTSFIEYHSKHIQTDEQGYLISFKDWNEEIAVKIAQLNGITLNPIHWDVIYFSRKFYMEYNVFPKVRTLINIIKIKYGEKKGNSRYFIKLFFSKSITQQIAKISGLPKPTQCL